MSENMRIGALHANKTFDLLKQMNSCEFREGVWLIFTLFNAERPRVVYELALIHLLLIATEVFE